MTTAWRGQSRLWNTATRPTARPLLTSFAPAALQAARSAQPQLPRGLLLDALPGGWLESAQALQCVAIVCQHQLWNTETVAQAKQAGFRLLSYTVNDEASASRLIALVQSTTQIAVALLRTRIEPEFATWHETRQFG